MNSTEKTLNNRTYWEMSIGEVTEDTPVTLALHYMTGDATSLQVLFEGLDRPMQVIFLQAQYPSGDDSLGGYSWFPDEERFYDRPEAEQAPDIQREVDQIADFLGALKHSHTGKIAVTGMSQGGDLTLALCAYYPHLIDLALPVAGRLSPALRPEQPPQPPLPRVSMMQGADDYIVSVASAQEAVEWLRGAGYDADLHVYERVGHAISKAMAAHIQQHLMAL